MCVCVCGGGGGVRMPSYNQCVTEYIAKGSDNQALDQKENSDPMLERLVFITTVWGGAHWPSG